MKAPFPRALRPGLLALALILAGGCRTAETARLPVIELRPVPPIVFRGGNSPSPDKPGESDCNNPAHWDGDTLYVFNSADHPWRLSGPDMTRLDQSYLKCQYDNTVNGGRWIESTWKNNDGTLYGWYHWEPGGICPDVPHKTPGMHLTAPRIGAVKSRDNGATWQDLGVVLETPAGSDRCDTKNYYFAGGNGDFSVMLDARKKYLYFYISTYPVNADEQGVAVARMRWADRDRPAGKVWKWRNGRWDEPGLGGRVTPIFPVARDWHEKKCDAFWGPSVHWNTHLRQYVMFLNRAKDENWVPEGLYITCNRDLANPGGWAAPQKLPLDQASLGWYPSILGCDQARRETDKLAGRKVRLFVSGRSRWEMTFHRPGEKP